MATTYVWVLLFIIEILFSTVEGIYGACTLLYKKMINKKLFFAILDFCTMTYKFPTEVLWLWIKIEKYEILYWDVYNNYTEKI